MQGYCALLLNLHWKVVIFASCSPSKELLSEEDDYFDDTAFTTSGFGGNDSLSENFISQIGIPGNGTDGMNCLTRLVYIKR